MLVILYRLDRVLSSYMQKNMQFSEKSSLGRIILGYTSRWQCVLV